MKPDHADNRAIKRREFLRRSACIAAGVGAVHLAGFSLTKTKHGQLINSMSDSLFSISLAEWSLHRTLREGTMSNLDFPVVSRKTYGIDAIEYVNVFFKDKARDETYLKELKSRCDGEGVKSLLIMCDGEGRLGDPDDAARREAVENHYRWVEAAKFLGCHSIRVNASSEGDWETQRSLAADGLRRLTEFGAEHEINVIVENHGGFSSNGKWLSEVMKEVDHERCGTLPDFGNFQTGPDEWYDRYKGVEELMPFAKAVSAKSRDFDDDGSERHTDYVRMMSIVLDAGYRGYVGVEYEGNEISEDAGIKATKALLVRVRDELADKYH